MSDFETNNNIQENVSGAKSESDYYKHLNLIHDLQDLVVDMSIAGTTTPDEDECLAQVRDIIQRIEVLKQDKDGNAQEIQKCKSALAYVMQKLDAIHKNDGVAIPTVEPEVKAPEVQDVAPVVSAVEAEQPVISQPVAEPEVETVYEPIYTETKPLKEPPLFDDDEDVPPFVRDGLIDDKRISYIKENIVEELASRNENILRDRFGDNPDNQLDQLRAKVKENEAALSKLSSINFIKRKKLAEEIEKANQKIKFLETLKVKNSFK